MTVYDIWYTISRLPP